MTYLVQVYVNLDGEVFIENYTIRCKKNCIERELLKLKKQIPNSSIIDYQLYE